MKDDKAGGKQVPAGDHVLTEAQVKRLSALSGVDAKSLTGLSISKIRDRFDEITINPAWLLFRKVCGRVVKKDPVTGQTVGVPFATVEVEDTDCHLISYFPSGWEWGWFFPFNCRREVIATVQTDACGNFCVWVPRFDIDYVLRWRHHRYCFPEVFKRPNLRDILTKEVLQQPKFPPPNPGDPVEFENLTRQQLHALAGDAGLRLADRLDRSALSRVFGGHVEDLEPDLNARAFDRELPPPLPEEFHRALSGTADVVAGPEPVDGVAAVRSAIALKLDVEVDEVAKLHPSRFIGPFVRCIDIVTPEWDRILDVPDITFRVLQDVNGDGVPETIYSEGYFDVRWDAGNIAPVTLVASDQAIGSTICHTPDVACSDVPEISFAGLMPLNNPAYFDATSGYALRPNKPKRVNPLPPHNILRDPAQTPFSGTLQLYGCVDIEGASYYRVQRSTDGGTTYVPIVGQPRHVYTFPGGVPVVPPEAPVDGWYTILRPEQDFHPANLIIELPTSTLARDLFRVEVGDAAKNPVGAPSASVAIEMDNTVPTVIPTRLAWRFASESDAAFALPGRNLLVNCPTIHRGASPHDIVVRFDVTVSANHLRDAGLSTSGCGTGNAFGLDGSHANVTEHWHTSAADNTVNLTGQFTLAGSMDEGSYGFGCTATSRAMNPAGSDGGNLLDWNYDPVYLYTPAQWNVAVVDS